MILMLSWRDISCPKAGGAEVYTHAVLSRLASIGEEIVHISPLFNGCKSDEYIDGIQYLRMGNIFSVIWYARKWIIAHRKRIKLVIDQSNTYQFFTPLWLQKGIPSCLFIHQLTREIWFQQVRFPLSFIGFLAEPIMIWMHKNRPALTVSDSTKRGLISFGHNPKRIFVMPEGIDFTPWEREKMPQKPLDLQLIYVGRYSKYKGVDDAVEAVKILSERGINATLHLVGRCPEAYMKKLKKAGIGQKLLWHGFVSDAKKLRLMSESHILVFPSQREGWGLTVTEANAVGTVAVGYPSPGLVDSIWHGQTGIIAKTRSAKGLADAIETLWAQPKKRKQMEKAAHEWAQKLTWDAAANAWKQLLQGQSGIIQTQQNERHRAPLQPLPEPCSHPQKVDR